MSIFINRIISNAYMSMYRTRNQIMESRTYIYESAIDKNIHRADELADSIAKENFVYNSPVKDANGNIQKYARSGREMRYNAEYIKHLVGEKIPFSKDKNSKAKFFLGATRIFGDILKNLHTEEINDGCTKLNKILGIIVNDSNHINEYDNNLNGLSLKELKDKFGQKVKDLSDKEKEEISSKNYIKNERYKIIPCETWEDMKQFGYPLTTWCVAQKDGGKHAYDSYTDNGLCKFYVCTRDGYENLEPERGPNCPLDDYGLSMIAICVDSEGNLKTCTCRWNHDNGGNDNIMTTKQISDLLGVNFFDRFKPRDPEDIFDKLEYDEYDPLCTKLKLRFDEDDNYYRIEDNKLIKYKLCCMGHYNSKPIACLANTHFMWFDVDTGKEIAPPENIDGDFDCSKLNDLISLKGGPSIINGYFDCSKCSKLTSLEGAPNKVSGYFYCHGCNNLETLKGAPSEVGGNFWCNGCTNLISLEGGPSKVGGNFWCNNCKNLTSLKGTPNKVGKDFDCSDCINLPSLEGVPSYIDGSFDCSRCNSITSLKGSPNKVGGDFWCGFCYNLISLEGAPSEVGGKVYCLLCDKLTSIDSAPESIRNKIER